MALSQADGVHSAEAGGTGIYALVVLAGLVLFAVAVSSAPLDTLDSLTDFVSQTLVIAVTNLLADVVLAQLVGQAVPIGVTDGLAESGVALKKHIYCGDRKKKFSNCQQV